MIPLFKIKIQKQGKEYYADADKVFGWLFERYMKSEERKENSRIMPYKERVQSFFAKAKKDESWLRELREAFPGIDLDQELQKAKTWLLSNGYKKNFKRFCFNWMAKANMSPARSKKTSFKMDTTGHYIAYCDKCGTSGFYDKYEINKVDSRCCNAKLLANRA
tara:strand:- start:568 stop:1056 length:489 start_codon:yes stop_codon:yes gene_type:complete